MHRLKLLGSLREELGVAALITPERKSYESWMLGGMGMEEGLPLEYNSFICHLAQFI
jgi:hypothetical protein